MKKSEYMEAMFGEEWRKCVREGRCWIIQNTIFNPFDGQGLNLICQVHEEEFNIPVKRGEWNVPIPSICPKGEKNKLI